MRNNTLWPGKKGIILFWLECEAMDLEDLNHAALITWPIPSVLH